MRRTHLVTGAAGFIGSHTCRRLLETGAEVVGVDNLGDYYDPALKKARLDTLHEWPGFEFVLADLSDRARVAGLFQQVEPDHVIHLAAQPGVRHALDHPEDYVDSNLVGFANVLEACRTSAVAHLVYASSSSVYGANTAMPFSVHSGVGHPVSLYAATKRANELMAHAYSHAFGLPTTGLRFFTVYGPWGRPDMAYYRFADAIRHDRPLRIFGDGTALRDFTYVDDIVDAVVKVAACPAKPDPCWDADRPDPATSEAPFRLLNIGHGCQVSVNRLVELLEASLGRPARRVHEGTQTGDVAATWADTRDLEALVGASPTTGIEEGLAAFVAWYRDYHGLGHEL